MTPTRTPSRSTSATDRDGRVDGHDVDALDDDVGRGEGDLGRARRVDGEEAEVGRARRHRLERLARRVEADAATTGTPSRSPTSRAMSTVTPAGRLRSALRENGVAEVDRGAQDAGRREVGARTWGGAGRWGHTGRLASSGPERLARCRRSGEECPHVTQNPSRGASLPSRRSPLPASPCRPRARRRPSTHTATGTVFLPNPVQDLGNETLTDQKDADYAGARRRVPPGDAHRPRRLRHADRRLRARQEQDRQGRRSASAARSRPSTATPTSSSRSWATTGSPRPRRYLQHLGFGSTLRPVNQRQIELRIDQFGGDNSFFREDKANITLGKGGVDDAEDAEVIVHEYGHSVQDGQVPGFGTNLESGAIGEAFGDYLAVVVTSWAAGHADGRRPRPASPTGTPSRTRAPCRTASAASTARKHYPEDVDRRGPRRRRDLVAGAVGHPRRARRHRGRAPSSSRRSSPSRRTPSFRDAATATVAAAQRLYGASAAPGRDAGRSRRAASSEPRSRFAPARTARSPLRDREGASLEPCRMPSAGGAVRRPVRAPGRAGAQAFPPRRARRRRRRGARPRGASGRRRRPRRRRWPCRPGSRR